MKMGTLMTFVAFTTVLCCFLPTMVTATFWGDWGEVEYCPYGEWAVGFSLKTEREQGGGDDSALNSISLKCSEGSRIHSTQGRFGVWGNNFNCPKGSWLTSCQLRVEPKQGEKDDTAANNMNCKCNNGEMLEGDGLTFGSWEEWSDTCNKGIVGVKTRVQEYQGTAGDDTSLNDVKFICWEERYI